MFMCSETSGMDHHTMTTCVVVRQISILISNKSVKVRDCISALGQEEAEEAAAAAEEEDREKVEDEEEVLQS